MAQNGMENKDKASMSPRDKSNTSFDIFNFVNSESAVESEKQIKKETKAGQENSENFSFSSFMVEMTQENTFPANIQEPNNVSFGGLGGINPHFLQKEEPNGWKGVHVLNSSNQHFPILHIPNGHPQSLMYRSVDNGGAKGHSERIPEKADPFSGINQLPLPALSSLISHQGSMKEVQKHGISEKGVSQMKLVNYVSEIPPYPPKSSSMPLESNKDSSFSFSGFCFDTAAAESRDQTQQSKRAKTKVSLCEQGVKSEPPPDCLPESLPEKAVSFEFEDDFPTDFPISQEEVCIFPTVSFSRLFYPK